MGEGEAWKESKTRLAPVSKWFANSRFSTGRFMFLSARHVAVEHLPCAKNRQARRIQACMRHTFRPSWA